MSIQLAAGFFYESIFKSFSDNKNILSLLSHLSYFELESNTPLSDQQLTSGNEILAVASNIISRGLPTRMPYELEKFFSDNYDFLKEDKNNGNILFDRTENVISLYHDIENALHIIDPRITPQNFSFNYEHSWEKLGSEYEEDFLMVEVPKYLGQQFIQLIEFQRLLDELIKDDIPTDSNTRDSFIKQRVDFSIEFPYDLTNYNHKGIIIEIDGRQHDILEQALIDKDRDHVARVKNWLPVRIETRNWNNLESELTPIKKISNENYFTIIEKCYQHDLSIDSYWRELLEFTLAPFAVARVQKSIIELILRNVLDINKSTWNICIVERDIPCAVLAINDLKELLSNLFLLEFNSKTLPDITLTVYSSDEFINSTLHNNHPVKLFNDLTTDLNIYDLVLDVSVLQRSRLSQNVIFGLQPINYFRIRSSHSIRNIRKVITSQTINYKDISSPQLDGSYYTIPELEYALTYFLRNIFRKTNFRIGQLPILSRALTNKNVIGLLPTGAGKSLTYQIASLLQPGLTLIIDPIKSLMKDQYDGLKRNMIDCCEFINSSKDFSAKNIIYKSMSKSEIQFIFVSPERLFIKDFRDLLEKELPNERVYFSYCVIDEAHCVSEWGHDFRTSYLHLGKNAVKYCKTKNASPITLFALTATASFDVLSDILKEISTENNQLDSSSVVRFETTNRPEIQYKIIEIAINSNGNNLWSHKEKLGQAKQKKINELLELIPKDLESFNCVSCVKSIFNSAYINDPIRNITSGEFSENTEFQRVQLEHNSLDSTIFFKSKNNAGIIFAPHRSSYFGVTNKHKNNKAHGIAQNIDKEKILDLAIGTFMGGDSSNDSYELMQSENDENQNDFIANKKNLMVCTKAFGMGIDKPNIRYSIHFNYPPSIESFIQESGRIGRDGKLSISYILFNKEYFNTGKAQLNIDESFLYDFHSNSFRGIEKELAVVNELLTNIEIPELTKEKYIQSLLQSNGMDVKVNFRRAQNRLIIRKGNNQYIGDINTVNSTVNGNDVLTLNKIVIILDSKLPDYFANLTQWFGYDYIGIRDIIEAYSQYDNLIIPFTNDVSHKLELLSKLMRDNIDNGHIFTNAQLKDIYEKLYNKSWDEFCEKVNTFYNKMNRGAYFNLDEYSKQLKTIFSSIRDKSDTEKAIYRLSILGIIDSYEVNYNAEVFIVSVKNPSQKNVRDNVYSYLSKYYSAQRIEAELNQVRNEIDFDGYLNYLIVFSYKEIAKKRRQAIQDMKDACLYLQQHSNIEFKDYIYYYFNSKYARKNWTDPADNVNKSLYDRFYINEQIKDLTPSQEIDIVWDFINHVGSAIDNFRHLRGACIRLLQLIPESIALHILKAYSVLAIEKDNELAAKDGVDSLLNGCSYLYAKINYNQVKYFDFIDKLVKKIGEQTNNQYTELIEDSIALLHLEAHNSWLNKTLKIMEV